jgi:histidinol-phosphate aminotransferase
MRKGFFRGCLLKDSKDKLYVEEEMKAEVKLDLSTNPVRPQDVEKILQKITIEDIHHYPETLELPELMEKISRLENVKQENTMLVAGADQGIEITLTHLLDSKNKVAIRIPTFPRFEIVARRLCGAEIIFFRDLNDIPDAKVVVLCSPNNPTTEEIPKTEIIKILEKNQDIMFILDSVFSDFGTWNPAALTNDFDNLVVLKSFSKSFSLAGLRVGWIVSQEENIKMLKKGVSPFRVPMLSQRIAFEIIKEKYHVKKSLEFLETEWKFIKKNLKTARRKTNVPFFLVETKEDSTIIWNKLLKKGIRVVDGKNFRGLGNRQLRVAIGPRKMNEIFIKEFLKINHE